jgi:ATP-dependent DNA ligase
LTEIEFTPDVFEKHKDWYFQEKENGVRVIGHFKHGKLSSVRGRRNNPLLHLFPELAELQLADFEGIIDGELIVADSTKKSIFYGGINQRDKKLHVENVKKFPATFVAFDVLYLNGQVLVDKPYSERLSLLKGVVANSDTAIQTFRVVENIANPKDYWDNKIVAENREGLVLKNPTGHYEVDTRSKNNLKLKNYKQTDVLIEKTEQNNAGTKIYGKATINGVDIEVECQVGGVKPESLKVGEKVPVVYLDIVGNRLVQPHKIKGFGLE